MCGIVGTFDRERSVGLAPALEVLKERGKDGFGIATSRTIFHSKNLSDIKSIEANIIGHTLHSVVGTIPQPIRKKGILTSNCEIYNWKQLREKYSLQSKNDSELMIDLFEKKGINHLGKLLHELDGVYAFAYWAENNVYIARDIIGVKPLWYSVSDGFAFASEKKALVKLGYRKVEELNPRFILRYDLKTKKLVRQERSFFTINKKADPKQVFEKTEALIGSAIKKRIPEQKFGLLFSGGIDSTFLANAFKNMGKDFTCYTAALDHEGMEEAQDLIYAKRIAKEMGFKLKIKRLDLIETKEYLGKVIPLIEDSNVVKAGVALTFFAACELAKKDGIKVIFSGLGSEEIFAGYERHKKSNDINKECLSGLLKMYERDLYRDDVITMHNNLELRLPFLDKALVEYALSIPENLKLDARQNKIILREIAKEQGIPEKYAERKKKAAQYGSKFDRAIGKLARKEGLKKSEYLKRFYPVPNLKIAVLWSGGKDSAYAAYVMKKQNYDLSCLISIRSKNPDSYMFHTPNIDLVALQAQAAELPIMIKETKGKKEEELKDLAAAIKRAKKEYGIEGIVTGALFSNYQRERIEKICDKLELKIFSPLWHIDQELEMRSLIKEGFTIIFSSIAGYGFRKDWLGRVIADQDIDKLVELHKRYAINIAGEGGEFESFVLDCPLFSKKIEIERSEIMEENESTARLIISEASLVEKS